MCMTIFYEKVIDNKKRLYRLQRVECLSKSELPEAYLQGYPRVYKLTRLSKTTKAFGNQDGLNLMDGMLLSPAEFDAMQDVFRRAGERLQQINKEIRESWQGEGVIEI